MRLLSNRSAHAEKLHLFRTGSRASASFKVRSLSASQTTRGLLERNGHEAKKIELIVKGGTWSAYPWDYRKWFIKRCFDAANHLGEKKKKRYANLAQSQKANESSEYRVIGLTIETRRDWINPKEIIRLRELGVTRVELGVQALDDELQSHQAWS